MDNSTLYKLAKASRDSHPEWQWEEWKQQRNGLFRSQGLNQPLRLAPYSFFDPFQGMALPCWDSRSSIEYAIRSWERINR